MDDEKEEFLRGDGISGLQFCGTGLYYGKDFWKEKREPETGNKMDTMPENKTGHCSEEFVLSNPYGLHARPASVFVQKALEFKSDIEVCNLSNNMTADGKSVLSMLMLAAPVGTRIRITVNGQDAQPAMNTLRDLVLRGFEDE